MTIYQDSDRNRPNYVSCSYLLMHKLTRTITSVSKIQSIAYEYLESTSRFIPSASPFLSRFTSSSTCQSISLIIPALVIHHSFTLLLEAQNLPFRQILSTLYFFYLLDCLMITGLDWTYHAHQFIFSFTFNFFLFIPCCRLSWLPVRFLLHVKYTLSRYVY